MLEVVGPYMVEKVRVPKSLVLQQSFKIPQLISFSLTSLPKLLADYVLQ
jgi:hypothetical protein